MTFPLRELQLLLRSRCNIFNLLSHPHLRLAFPWLVSFSLFLALCLIVCAVVAEFNDFDDEPALPNLPVLVALIGLISSVILPRLRLFSRRWPPPLRPPQRFSN